MWCIREAKDRFLDHFRVGRSLSSNTLKAYAADFADFATFVGGEEAVGGVGRDRLRDNNGLLAQTRSTTPFASHHGSGGAPGMGQ